MRTSRWVVSAVVLLGVGGCDGHGTPVTPAAPAPAAPSHAAPSSIASADAPATVAPAAAASAAAAPAAGVPVGAPPAAVATSARDGVDLEAITIDGLSRTSLDVNPFRSEAELVFQASEISGAVFLRVKVHDDATTARDWLLAKRQFASPRLVPAAELGLPGDMGFGAKDAHENVAYALLLRANVTCTASFGAVAGGGAAPSDGSLLAVVTAWSQAVDASPALALGVAPSRPRITGFVADGPARAGQASPLRVDVDRTGPAAWYFAYEASGGASVVASKTGPMLYVASPGVVKVRVAASTRRLGSAVLAAEIEVEAR